MHRPTRLAAIGGVAGPAAFIGAWGVLGTRLKHYNPLHDPISRLAAIGSSTRAPMTAGFLAFSVGLALYALSARDHLSRRVAALAAVNAAATIGVAAFPLEGFGGSFGHAASAFTGYATLAAMPAVHGRRGGKALSAVIAAALVLSIVDESHTGLFQRSGLTLGDAWIVATALSILQGRSQP
ncbi:MAG TPA: DUF998 domain-containing protein [Acidimicrobiales bacterium]|nr:DUF998 domain-containing protein [Acidimicrobiales bacterium]